MEIKKVLVIGAGQMGSGIAQVMAQGGLESYPAGYRAEVCRQGMGGIEKNLAKTGGKKENWTQRQKDATYKRLCGVVELDAAACKVDLVVEAAGRKYEYQERDLQKTGRTCVRNILFLPQYLFFARLLRSAP